MDERREKQLIQQAFETSLSGLKDDPWLARRVIAQARETERTPVKVKRKLSVGLIVMIALMLVTVTAVAVALTWQQYAPTVKQMEYEQGSYATWPAADRVNLVHALIEMGHLDKSEDTEKLFAEGTSEKEQQAIADRLLLDLTGQTDIQEINLNILTYALMGYEDFWTPEQRVWWQEITNMFRDENVDPNTFVLPEESCISEDEAIRIAKSAIIAAYELPSDYLDDAQPVANLYVTDERPDYRRWSVAFKQYRDGSDHWTEKQFNAIVDENGNVIGDPDIPEEHVAVRGERAVASRSEPVEDETAIYHKYASQVNFDPFWFWPYELKAAYSAEIIPVIENMESMNYEVGISTLCIYGLPRQNDLSHDEALRIAQDAVMEKFSLSISKMNMYSRRFEYFDITDSNQPIWKFVLVNPDDYRGTMYRVEIDAQTADVLKNEAFPWKQLDWRNDIIYIQEWYY